MIAKELERVENVGILTGVGSFRIMSFVGTLLKLVGSVTVLSLVDSDAMMRYVGSSKALRYVCSNTVLTVWLRLTSLCFLFFPSIPFTLFSVLCHLFPMPSFLHPPCT